MTLEQLSIIWLLIQGSTVTPTNSAKWSRGRKWCPTWTTLSLPAVRLIRTRKKKTCCVPKGGWNPAGVS